MLIPVRYPSVVDVMLPSADTASRMRVWKVAEIDIPSSGNGLLTGVVTDSTTGLHATFYQDTNSDFYRRPDISISEFIGADGDRPAYIWLGQGCRGEVLDEIPSACTIVFDQSDEQEQAMQAAASRMLIDLNGIYLPIREPHLCIARTMAGGEKVAYTSWPYGVAIPSETYRLDQYRLASKRFGVITDLRWQIQYGLTMVIDTPSEMTFSHDTKELSAISAIAGLLLLDKKRVPHDLRDDWSKLRAEYRRWHRDARMESAPLIALARSVNARVDRSLLSPRAAANIETALSAYEQVPRTVDRHPYPFA